MTVAKKTEMEVVGGEMKRTNVIIFAAGRRHHGSPGTGAAERQIHNVSPTIHFEVEEKFLFFSRSNSEKSSPLLHYSLEYTWLQKGNSWGQTTDPWEKSW